MVRAALIALSIAILAPVSVFGRLQGPAPKENTPVAPEPSSVTAPGLTASPSEVSGDPQDRVAVESKGSASRTLRDSQAALKMQVVPPDGVWLVDPEGRSYFIWKYPKSQPFTLLSKSRVRIVHGGQLDLAGEDDDSLWLKVYRPSEASATQPTMPHVPTAAALAAAAATFHFSAATVDRLHLKSFDVGLPTSGLWRNGFDIADIDGDGEMDFAHGPTRRGGDQPNLFLGNGHGTWHSYPSSVPTGVLDYGDIKVADFNGDGKADLAMAIHLRGLAVFVGNGAGKFSSWSKGLDFVVPRSGYDGSGFSSRRIEVLDWNQDGKPDLLALSEGPRISISSVAKTTTLTGANVRPAVFGPKVFLNNGNGTWTALAESGARREIFGDDLAVADFDGNGSPDFLISSNAMGRMDLLYMHGNEHGGPWASVDLPLRSKAYVNAVSVEDFDHDRRPDIAVTYTSFELGVSRVGLDVYLAQSGGRWERHPVYVVEGRRSLTALDGGDVDGDGSPDLVATDVDGFLYLFLGDGKGSFAREESPEAQQPRGDCRGYGLEIVDINHDGRGEIFATYAGDSNPVFAPLRCSSQGGVAAWSVEIAK